MENQFAEIKGDHFFKGDGTMCNPYDHDQDDVYEEKHQFMILNNVKIIKSSECKQIRDYFKSKYDSMSHIKSFKQL